MRDDTLTSLMAVNLSTLLLNVVAKVAVDMSNGAQKKDSMPHWFILEKNKEKLKADILLWSQYICDVAREVPIYQEQENSSFLQEEKQFFENPFLKGRSLKKICGEIYKNNKLMFLRLRSQIGLKSAEKLESSQIETAKIIFSRLHPLLVVQFLSGYLKKMEGFDGRSKFFSSVIIDFLSVYPLFMRNVVTHFHLIAVNPTLSETATQAFQVKKALDQKKRQDHWENGKLKERLKETRESEGYETAIDFQSKKKIETEKQYAHLIMVLLKCRQIVYRSSLGVEVQGRLKMTVHNTYELVDFLGAVVLVRTKEQLAHDLKWKRIKPYLKKKASWVSRASEQIRHILGYTPKSVALG